MLGNLRKNELNTLLLPLLLLPVWIVLYLSLRPFAGWFVCDLFGMSRGEPFAEALWFFVYEFPKVMLLLVLIIFAVGIVRTWFTPERTRRALEGKKTFTGNVLAALLGIVTPFCSCSAIPLFLGFVEAGVPLGVTVSFLISAPMINEVAVVLLYGMFGWKTVLLYVGTGLAIAIAAGYVIGLLKLDRWVEDWVYQTKVGRYEAEGRLTFAARIRMGFGAVREIVGRVWPFVALGIAVGAGAHGYVPADYMAALMGKDSWYTVPLSVLIGIPLYSNAAGIVPIVSVLIEKGASLGTALAFMMAVIGLSLPEMVILRKVLKMPLIITFIAIVGAGIIITGYLFNWIL